MKTVAIFTGPEKQCGIHYYADTVIGILKNSQQYQYKLIDVGSEAQFRNELAAQTPDLMVINWHPWTMPWCTPNLLDEFAIPKFLIIGHASLSDNLPFRVNKFISIDPDHKSHDNYVAGVRPVKFYDDIAYTSPFPRRLAIGTSGIGHSIKNLEYLTDLIRIQYTGEYIVDFRVHFSVGRYTDHNETQIRELAKHCQHRAGEAVQISLTCRSFDDYGIVKWLNQNDINIFLYNNFDSIGVSASIDKALAAKKPIGVNESNFFRHIYSKDIDIGQNLLTDIIKKGTSPLEKFYHRWNPQELIMQYDTLVSQHV